MLDDIRKCSQSVSKNTVEQTAYFRAWGAKNNLDMEKYRAQIERELEAEAKKKQTGLLNLNFISQSVFYN